MPELHQFSQSPAQEEKKPWTGLTKEKQREFQILATSARIQVRKSVRDLTSDIRQLRRALETSKVDVLRNGEDLPSVEVLIAARDLSHRKVSAPEEDSQGISDAEEAGHIPAVSNPVPTAAVGQSGAAYVQVDQSLNRRPVKPSILCRANNVGRPTIASQLRSKVFKSVNDGQETRVARKCEACSRQVSEQGTLHTETRKRQAKDERQCHSCGGTLPLRKRTSVPSRKRCPLSDGLGSCFPWEPLSPTTMSVAPSSPILPREKNPSNSRQQIEDMDIISTSACEGCDIIRKQNQGSSDKKVPRAKLLETYLEERGKKEIHKQKARGGRVVLKDVDHPQMEILSRDFHRRFKEKKFAEAVENYLMKLMTYEENVLRRWFDPSENLPQVDKELQLNPAKVLHYHKKWLSPGQLQQLKRHRHAHGPKMRSLQENQELSSPVRVKCSKRDRVIRAENIERLGEQRSSNKDSSYHTKFAVRRSPVDRNLALPTTDPADVRVRKRSEDEAVKLLIQDHLSGQCRSGTDLVGIDRICDKKTKLAVKIDRIADSLLDEALEELADELRIWCEKVVNHLISGELGTRIL